MFIFRLDTAVVYIDTESKFKQQRLLQIMGVQLKTATPTSSAEAVNNQMNALAKRVHVIQPKTGTFQPSSAKTQSNMSISSVQSTIA